MYRSHSQQHTRPSYENISSRINRLRSGNSNSHSSLSKAAPVPLSLHQPLYSISTSGLPSASIGRPTSCYRSALKVQDGGIFGIDISNHVGRVAKNTGIKKYNQRHIKDAINYRNSQRNHEEHSNRNQFDSIGKHEIRNQKLMNAPANRPCNDDTLHLGDRSSIKIYDYVQESSAQVQKVSTFSAHAKSLEPGRIYTAEQLARLM